MPPPNVTLIGVPSNSSGTPDGVARAPRVLRQRGLATILAGRPGFTDLGDLSLPAPRPERGPSGLLAEDALIGMIKLVAEAVRTARARGSFPLLVGGDCPLLLGALTGLQGGPGRVGLLFVDGHEDAWPPWSSPTGEAADCELGLALGLFDDDLDPDLLRALPVLRPSDVIAVGPRDHDELALAAVPSVASRVRALLRPEGLSADRVTAAAAVLPDPFWLHVDLDVLATSEFPAVDYPQPGGLSWAQLGDVTATALAAIGCAGMSVCIYNPDLDPQRSAADDVVNYIGQAVTPVAAG